MKNVLIGCEYSQVIMSVFYEGGFNAYSCDKLPCEGKYRDRHIRGDLLDVIKMGVPDTIDVFGRASWTGEGVKWDLLIAHPPCTYISFAGTASWNDRGRVFKRIAALEFFARCLENNIPKICVENPLGCAESAVRKSDQTIQPYYFGDSEQKRTCLWLKKLPPLVHLKQDDLFGQATHAAKPDPKYISKDGTKLYFADAISGAGAGGHKRSKSFSGIANAMIEQWRGLI